MAKYRKKPVVVDVFHLQDLSNKTVREALVFMGQMIPRPRSLEGAKQHEDALVAYHDKVLRDDGIVINTLEGDMKASSGDYIIKGIKGELYPCKPDIFIQTYEEVSE